MVPHLKPNGNPCPSFSSPFVCGSSNSEARIFARKSFLQDGRRVCGKVFSLLFSSFPFSVRAYNWPNIADRTRTLMRERGGMSGHANNAMRREWEISPRKKKKEEKGRRRESLLYKLGRTTRDFARSSFHHNAPQQLLAAPGSVYLLRFFFVGLRQKRVNA